MKFLIDTNVLIPLEPANDGTTALLAARAAELNRRAVQGGHQVFVHPAMHRDIRRDKVEWRRDLRGQQLQKYARLDEHPDLPESLKALVGSPAPGSNDWVDNQLLAALASNAVDYLVTEDNGLHRKARRVGLSERVARVEDALVLLSELSDSAPHPPPPVRPLPAYGLNASDPIFDSFREDYPGFDAWLAKCQKEHRQSWLINGPDGRHAGIVIVNPEMAPEPPMSGRVLKICTMKVSPGAHGLRYGELLLKVVFEYAQENGYAWVFVTVFEKHAQLVELLEDFGFTALEQKSPLGELILVKPLRHSVAPEDLAPLDHHIRYGPHSIAAEGVDWYIVPILPRFTSILIPETESQIVLLDEPRPYGNAIRKAYLCHANVTTIEPGALLFFYRSEAGQGVVAIGVTERIVRSGDPDEIARAVGRRTVYPLDAIREMCRKPVLAILFRQARIIQPPISALELEQGGVFIRPPQSIMKIQPTGREWLRNRLRL